MKRSKGIIRNRITDLAERRNRAPLKQPTGQFEGQSRFSRKRLQGELEMVDGENLKRPFMEDMSTQGTIEGGRPPWVTLYEQCQGLLMSVEDLRNQMLANQNKRLSSVRLAEEKECEIKIYECAKAATRKIRECEQVVSRIQSIGNSENPVNAKMCQSLCLKLASEIQDATRRLRGQEKSFIEQRKQFEQTEKVSFLEVAAEHALSNNGAFLDDELIEDEEFLDLKERSEEVRKIVESIYELNNIFKDLNQLVILQGSLLDRIDENIEIGQKAVDKGRKHLQKAEKYQKKTSKCSCYTMVALLVAITILLIILMARWFS